MSDITAVVLTIGEDTTERAIESLKRQTVPPEEVIVIENVAPFHKALNLGASKVKTEYFVQVDADMILDANCLEELRSCFRKDTGLVAGYLRDEVMGRQSGVKMFRTKCFEAAKFKDTISPDTDFAEDLRRQGYRLRYTRQTLGEQRHSPDPAYFFSKYLLEGIRYRYRKAGGAIVWRFKQLVRQGHELSLICQMGLARGIFLKGEEDLLKPFSADKDYSVLKAFSEKTEKGAIIKSAIPLFFIFKPETVFRKFCILGAEIRKRGAFASLESCIDDLGKSYDPFAWIAKVGLCQGFFSGEFSEERSRDEYAMLEDLLSKYNIFYVVAKKMLSIPMSIFLPVRFKRPERYKIWI